MSFAFQNNSPLNNSAFGNQPTAPINPTQNGNPPQQVAVPASTFLPPNDSNNNSSAPFGNQNSTPTAEGLFPINKPPTFAQTRPAGSSPSSFPIPQKASLSLDPKSISYEEERYEAYQTQELKDYKQAFSYAYETQDWEDYQYAALRLKYKLKPTFREVFLEEVYLPPFRGAKSFDVPKQPQPQKNPNSQNDNSLLRPTLNTSFSFGTNQPSIPSQSSKSFQSSGCGGCSQPAAERDAEGSSIPKCSRNFPPNSGFFSTGGLLSDQGKLLKKSLSPATGRTLQAKTCSPSTSTQPLAQFKPFDFSSSSRTVVPGSFCFGGTGTHGVGDQQKSPAFTESLPSESGTSQTRTSGIFQWPPALVSQGNLAATQPPTTSTATATSSLGIGTGGLSLNSFEPKLEQFTAEVKKALLEAQVWAELSEHLQDCKCSFSAMKTILAQSKSKNGQNLSN